VSRRVVITGAGLRSALGSSPATLFDALLADRSAVRRVAAWDDIPDLECHIGGPLLDYNARELPRKNRRTMGRVAMLAVSSARDAAASAGLDASLLASPRVGVVMGSTTGSPASEEDFWGHYVGSHSARGLKATTFFQIMSHTAATNVAMTLGVTGPTWATNAACASSSQALGLAFDLIRWGRVDVALAGGAEELHAATVITFDAMGGASRGHDDAPTVTPRPFDAGRDGIVCAEGGAVLVLEERDHALARGATIHAEVLGFGATSDAVNMAAPAPEGMVAAVEAALDDAKLDRRDVHYVNAHATGTPLGDAAEAEALHRVFGGSVPVSSIKGHTGHTLGACGATEAVVTVEAMRRGVVPHTRNLVRPDVAPLLLPRQPLERPLDVAMSTSFAFGGVNCALILGRGGSRAG